MSPAGPDFVEPAPGTTVEVAPGIRWLSTPLPFRLRAINLYLLDGDTGWTIVDSGYARDDVRSQWESVWAGLPGNKPVSALYLTHYHPDHAGNTGWICDRWNLLPHMTQAEWLTANLALAQRQVADRSLRVAFYVRHGLAGDALAQFQAYPVRYSDGVQMPPAFRRLVNDQIVSLGRYRWQVVVGRGHSPEHASFYCDEAGVFLAGDQVLPGITPNISVWPDEPDADPLGLYLSSLDHLEATLPDDILVLPSHRLPFRGLHGRIRQIRLHHHQRLDLILSHLSSAPTTAASLLPVLFRTDLDPYQIGFAMGEALAHLNYLLAQGQLRSERQGQHILFQRS
jgi:glyoxylase-like metal-dependent hydrolase (beta-lactamase superfamily II)